MDAKLHILGTLAILTVASCTGSVVKFDTPQAGLFLTT